MGGKCHGLRLFLPQHCNIRLIAISVPEAKNIIPTIKGSALIHLSDVCNHTFVHYDGRSINGCAQVALEVVGPNKDFEKLYSSDPDKNVLFNIRAYNDCGALKLWRSFFIDSGKGFYRARLRAFDKNGKQVGLCGDHFLIFID